jgi:hypothetical protein
MSLNIVSRAANDPQLQARILAAVNDEARTNPELQDTVFAAQVRQGFVNMTTFHWSVAEAVQLAYEAGVQAGRGAPGYDQDVVTDQAIIDAIVANWPPDVAAPLNAGAFMGAPPQ